MLRTRFHSFSGLSACGAGLAITLAFSIGFPGTASALPVGSVDDPHESLRPPSTWEEIEAASVDFTAIVALSNCSGSLVRFTTSKPDDPAMVLTNGHCNEFGFIGAGTAIYKRSSSRAFSLLSANASRTLGTLRANQIMYATMTGTDITLYRLNQTYNQIAHSYRVAPMIIQDHHPTVGTPIRVVSGYWRRIYSCSIDHFVHQLKEDQWTWDDSINYHQPGCETIGGTSGSPVINPATHEIIGINNTGNESGQRCTLDNPCEVDESGTVTYKKGTAYGQQLYHIYTCVSPTNEIDLDRVGCKLNKP